MLQQLHMNLSLELIEEALTQRFAEPHTWEHLEQIVLDSGTPMLHAPPHDAKCPRNVQVGVQLLNDAHIDARLQKPSNGRTCP